MYLWNTQALASQLRSGNLSQAERFKYFFTGVIIYNILFETFPYIKTTILSISALMESFIAVIITVLGTYWSYTANKTRDNREFIDRYICLSIPLGIRLLVAVYAICFAVTFISVFLLGKQYGAYKELIHWINFSVTNVLLGIFYWFMVRNIKIVADNEAD